MFLIPPPGQQPQDPALIAAEAHVSAALKWKQAEYRLDKKGKTPDGKATVVWAVWLDDERKPVPSGRKSRILHVDDQSKKVVKELRFQ